MGDNKKFAAECLDASNVYRKKHGVQDLILNSEISKVSQKWADHLIKKNQMGHNPNALHKGEQLGENIAMKYSSDRSEYTGYEAVDQWYKEISNYNFDKHFGSGTGHFTQLVWKGSREMGVGRAQASNGKWIVVVNYYPPGNYIGEYAENVFSSAEGNTSSSTTSSNLKRVQASTRVEVKEEIIGSGRNAMKKTITIETTTTPDGRTQTKRREEIRPVGNVGHSYQEVRGNRNANGYNAEESVSRQVHQELIGSGADAKLKVVTIETFTDANGNVHNSKKEEIRSRSPGYQNSSSYISIVWYHCSMTLKTEAMKSLLLGEITKDKNVAIQNESTFKSKSLDSTGDGDVLLKIGGPVITYQDISNRVKIQNKMWGCRNVDKLILHNLSGIFKPGMNAIMGPSGGGKSTLLDVLAGRKDPSGLSGVVMVDDKKQPSNFGLLSGYVIQEDIVMGTLSVRENIMFSANLRLPGSTNYNEKKKLVEAVINELGLTNCADTKVGTDLIRGISGGEKKRTCIGMEMIISPNILFLDEPTTGLDSNTAVAVMSLLHKLSFNGRTIIFSIHQPRYSTFKLFNRLTLLADGRTVYHGPADEALQYFESIGYTCEMHDNPSDFLIDVIKEGYSRIVEDETDDSYSKHGYDRAKYDHPEKLIAVYLNQKYLQSHWAYNIESELAGNPIPEESDNISLNCLNIEQYPTSFITQFRYLAGRTIKNMLRSPHVTFYQLLANILVALVVGLLFLRLDLRNDPIEVAIQNRAGVLFYIVINQIFTSMPGVNIFIGERVLFRHENSSGYYRTISYFCSKLFCYMLPMRIISSSAFAIVSYFMIGFPFSLDKFLIFYFGTIATALSSSALSFATGVFVKTASTGSLILNVLFVFMMLFGGFFSNLKSMGKWISWISYLSLIRYSLNIQFANQFSGVGITAFNGSISYIDYSAGNKYLDNLGIQHGTPSTMVINFIALLCMTVALLIMSYVKLRNLPKYR